MRQLLIILLACSFTSVAMGQDIRYRDIKNEYTRKEYKVKPENPEYSPFVAGIVNWWFPGIGYYYLDEPTRGTIILSGHLIATGASFTGIYMLLEDNLGDESYDENLYHSLILGGMAADILINIFSIIDAVHIAKVKNHAYALQAAKPVSLKLKPSLMINPAVYGYQSAAPGITLSLKF